jgi:hypothetical protein
MDRGRSKEKGKKWIEGRVRKEGEMDRGRSKERGRNR